MVVFSEFEYNGLQYASSVGGAFESKQAGSPVNLAEQAGWCHFPLSSLDYVN